MVYSDSRNTDGVRRRPLPLIGTYHKISIHAPLTGCDFSLNINNADVEQISIHAPLTGCDLYLIYLVCHYYNFNPRTPDGVRQP